MTFCLGASSLPLLQQSTGSPHRSPYRSMLSIWQMSLPSILLLLCQLDRFIQICFVLGLFFFSKLKLMPEHSSFKPHSYYICSSFIYYVGLLCVELFIIFKSFRGFLLISIVPLSPKFIRNHSKRLKLLPLPTVPC